MHSVHLAISAAVALLVQTAAYPVYEPGAYRGSDWETKYGDKESEGFTDIGSQRWARPETRWGYPAYAAKESEPTTEVVEKAKKVVEEVETKDIKPVEEETELLGLSEIDDVDDFDLDAVLFIEEMAEEPGMPPGMPPAPEAVGSEAGYDYIFFPWIYLEYESVEAPMSIEEPFGLEYYPYTEPTTPSVAEPSYPTAYPPQYPPAYPPQYPPTEAPVPAPEPEVVPTVVVAPPVKKPKRHKKAEKCEEGPCPCECAETGTPCYCYPALPKRHYPSYYTPQYSPYTHFGKEYPSPYYEPEQPTATKKTKKTEPHKVKPDVEPEPEAVPVKPHKKPKKPVPEEPEVPVVKPKRPKHPGREEEVPEPEVTKVGVYPHYGYPHGKYASTYTHYYYGPQEEVPMYCQPPKKCEPETYPGYQYSKHEYPEHKKPAEKKKKCRKCRKCKRCGPCVEDEHGCAKETDDN